MEAINKIISLPTINLLFSSLITFFKFLFQAISLAPVVTDINYKLLLDVLSTTENEA